MKSLLLFMLSLSSLSAQAVLFTVGDNFTLTVTAQGTNTASDPFRYQWYKNGVVWPGMVADHIDFTNCQLFDAGTFKCDVTNSAGKTTAPDFSVTINPKVAPAVAPTAAVITAVKK